MNKYSSALGLFILSFVCAILVDVGFGNFFTAWLAAVSIISFFGVGAALTNVSNKD